MVADPPAEFKTYTAHRGKRAGPSPALLKDLAAAAPVVRTVALRVPARISSAGV
jgi:hypothetical protein